MVTQDTLTAVLAEREREVARLATVREAQRASRPSARPTAGWTWRVEPGMEEVFRSLRGWLLSSIDAGQVEYLSARGQSS
jgi:hypothetical protein